MAEVDTSPHSENIEEPSDQVAAAEEGHIRSDIISMPV